MNTELAAIEANRLLEQIAFDSLKTAAERNVLGQFATPPALSMEIALVVRQLWRDADTQLRLLEPAIGSGSFYSALKTVFPADMWQSSIGVEIDPIAADIAQRLWSATGLTVLNRDFTTLTPPTKVCEKPNLIVTNPPYVRHHHISGADKARLRDLVSSTLGLDTSGLSGLYCYFILLCHAWLQEGGLSVWLIPSEFMDVNYGKSIRNYLTDRVTLLRVHRFDASDVRFDDALVTSSLVIFRNEQPSPHHFVEFSDGSSLVASHQTKRVPIEALRRQRKWSIRSSNGSDRVVQDNEAQLSDLFKIQRGIATGANELFVLTRNEADECGLPPQYLKPILPSTRYMKHPVIESDDDGFPILDKQLVLIDCPISELELKHSHPNLWKYLERGKEQGFHERYLVRKRQPWYRQEQRAPAPFICTYMGRRRTDGSSFRFYWNKSDAIAHNVYLLLYPKDALAKALAADPGLFPVVFNLLQGIDAGHLRDEGRVYGGGLHKLEPKELGRISAAPFLSVLELAIHGEPKQAYLLPVTLD